METVYGDKEDGDLIVYVVNRERRVWRRGQGIGRAGRRCGQRLEKIRARGGCAPPPKEA